MSKVYLVVRSYCEDDEVSIESIWSTREAADRAVDAADRSWPHAYVSEREVDKEPAP